MTTKKPKISYSKLDQYGNFKASDNAIAAVKAAKNILNSPSTAKKRKG